MPQLPQPSNKPLPEDVKSIALEAIDNHGKTNIITVSDGTLGVLRRYVTDESDLFKQHQAAQIAMCLDELNPLFTKQMSYDELVLYCGEMRILQTYSHRNDHHNNKRVPSNVQR